MARLQSYFINKALPLGHGTVLGNPDKPYQIWGYTNGLGERVVRNNPIDFLDASDAMCRAMQCFRAGSADYAAPGIPPDDRRMLGALFMGTTSPDENVRHATWLDHVKKGTFSFGAEEVTYVAEGAGSWKCEALGELKDGGDDGDRLSAGVSPERLEAIPRRAPGAPAGCGEPYPSGVWDLRGLISILLGLFVADQALAPLCAEACESAASPGAHGIGLSGVRLSMGGGVLPHGFQAGWPVRISLEFGECAALGLDYWVVAGVVVVILGSLVAAVLPIFLLLQPGGFCGDEVCVEVLALWVTVPGLVSLALAEIDDAEGVDVGMVGQAFGFSEFRVFGWFVRVLEVRPRSRPFGRPVGRHRHGGCPRAGGWTRRRPSAVR